MRILVVDDVAANRRLLRAILEAEDWSVDEASDGAEALALLERVPADAVISDVLMPRMDGFALCRRIRLHDRLRCLPVIIYTSTYNSPGDERAAMLMGADQYLVKPAPASALIAAVKELCGTGKVRRPAEPEAASELLVMEEYNTALVRKLEEKNEELAEKIAASHQTEQQLRESEERFRQLAENINEVFWMTDPAKQRMLYISPAYEVIWGRTCASLYGSPLTWSEAIHPDDRSRVLEAAVSKQILGTYDETYRIIRPDGAFRWIRDRAFPVRNSGGEIYRMVGTAEDITERKETEARIEQLAEQFRQAQKMEAIGTLAGGIAHDFNNVLGAIIGYTELAKMSLEGPPNVGEYLESVLQAARRATNLVRQILAFSRQQPLQRKLISLGPCVSEPLKLLRAAVPATIDFQIAIAPKLPSVLADATQIHQIVMNLGSNAAHAMRDRPGRLTVRLESCEVDSDFAAAHPGLQARRYVRLTMADTGHGMDQATIRRAFEPFFTTKGPGEGTGLGLSVVHGIMQSHEGAVTVHSRPGEGTTFRLYFPAQAGPKSEEAAAAAPTPKGSGQRVLFIDDEESLAKLGRTILEKLGYAAEAATSSLEALKTVRDNPRRYDLVVTDQMMPKLIGSDLARHLLAVRPDLPIVLMTGYSATLTEEKVRAMGIRELLFKPLSIGSVGAVVARALEVKS